MLIMHRSSFSFKNLQNFFNVGYGYKESMVVYERYHYHANDIKRLVKKYNILFFDVSEQLKGDPFIFESSYPSKYLDGAKYFFSKENKKENCDILYKAKAVNLFKCNWLIIFGSNLWLKAT